MEHLTRARPKRKRTSGTANGSSRAFHPPQTQLFPNAPSAAATEDDKKRWKGFCEIESEPAFFNVMLKDFGVRGVKIQEVFGLEDELVAFLSQPVHGLIFLLRSSDSEPNEQESNHPARVWFANQTHGTSCATVALLNILMNNPSIDIGEKLESFKTSTKDLAPPLRGEAVGSFEHVRHIHNTFARKMDMLEEDLAIRDEFETKKCGDDSSEATFHFVAFVPYQDMVWKLDGLERDAQCLGGSRSSEWLNLARPFIEAMIAERGGVDLHFALLALVGDPLGSFVSVLAENVKALQKLRTRLNAVEPDWRSFSVYDDVDDGGGVILGPDMVYGLDDESISQATLSPFYEEKLRANTASSLMGFRQELITAQASLRRSFQEEHQNVQSEEVRAATRRHDFGPMILEWLQMLCKKGQLKSLIERAEDNFMNYQR